MSFHHMYNRIEQVEERLAELAEQEKQQEVMSTDEALVWCAEHGAQVNFIHEQVPRVRLQIGGYPSVERYTFLEAVQDVQKLMREHDRLRKIE